MNEKAELSLKTVKFCLEKYCSIIPRFWKSNKVFGSEYKSCLTVLLFAHITEFLSYLILISEALLIHNTEGQEV